MLKFAYPRYDDDEIMFATNDELGGGDDLGLDAGALAEVSIRPGSGGGRMQGGVEGEDGQISHREGEREEDEGQYGEAEEDDEEEEEEEDCC